MRIGADPDDLEALAALHDDCAAHLARVGIRLRSTQRGAWTGPAARRWWAHADGELIPTLAAVGNRSAAAASHLRAQARAQRTASLPDVRTTALVVDRSGDGRWIARTGAPDAELVVVLVPGVGTDLGDVARLGSDAQRLWRTLASHADSHESVAVVSWLGYDPPDNVVSGIARGPAVAGGDSLAGDVRALRDAGARRVVVVGHSYGALVVARASAAGMAADEVVMLGAPGLGVGGPGELRLPPGAELWSARAAGDPIGLVAATGWVHGPDPGRFARSLPTSGRGHDGYLRDPRLLDALAALVVRDLPSSP